MTDRLKLILAVLLVLSASLPQYTCVTWRAPDGGRWQDIPPGADSSRYQREVESHYAFERFDPLLPELWLTVLCFGWPAAVLTIRARARRPRLKAAAWWVEPFLAAGSGYLILLFSSLGQRAIGAWLGTAACAGWLGVWLFELVRRFRKLPA